MHKCKGKNQIYTFFNKFVPKFNVIKNVIAFMSKQREMIGLPT